LTVELSGVVEWLKFEVNGGLYSPTSPFQKVISTRRREISFELPVELLQPEVLKKAFSHQV